MNYSNIKYTKVTSSSQAKGTKTTLPDTEFLIMEVTLKMAFKNYSDMKNVLAALLN